MQFITNRKNVCLTSDQARYIYIKVEKVSLGNVESIEQDIENDSLDNYYEEEKMYKSMFIKNYIGLILMSIHHKWNNGQYFVVLLVMFSIIGILEIILN